MRQTIFFLYLIGSGICLQAQKKDQALQRQLEQLIKGFNGDIGIYVHDLSHNKVAMIQADSIFPTASIVKIPILIGIMHKMQEGQLDYHQILEYKDSLFYQEGDDLLASFKPGEKIELSKVMLLSLSTSDNCASLWLQGLAGGGVRINAILDSLGLRSTRVNSSTPGREDNRKQYGWGQTTPHEIAAVMENIVRGEIFNRGASEKMLRLLGRQYWDEEALSQIPPNVFAADKNGAVDASRSEIVYVNGPHPYIFSVMTKNNKDQGWGYNNEAWVLIRQLSTLLWQYFNPNFIYKGAPSRK